MSEKILVVDDEREIADLLEKMKTILYINSIMAPTL